MSAPEKAGDYEIIQSVRLGGRVMLLGYNPHDKEATYMTCYQQYNFLGETMYPEALACKSYLEIAETFLNRLQAQVEKVKAFRAARNVPYAVLGAEACLPPSEGSLQGKLIVLRPTSLAPEYRTADCQLGFALSGFGCTPGARGRAVYFSFALQCFFRGFALYGGIVDYSHSHNLCGKLSLRRGRI